jgi:hypothetical protein
VGNLPHPFFSTPLFSKGEVAMLKSDCPQVGKILLRGLVIPAIAVFALVLCGSSALSQAQSPSHSIQTAAKPIVNHIHAGPYNDRSAAERVAINLRAQGCYAAVYYGTNPNNPRAGTGWCVSASVED